MKILVTGSEGSLMQYVIPRLLKDNHEVVGVDSCIRYGKIKRKRKYAFIEGDLSDFRFANKAANGVEGIIQAAARIYGIGGFHKYPADILSRDVTLHQNILWAALKNKVKKVCYISSSMVYERCTAFPSKEKYADSCPIPSTDYGLSKVVGERLSRAFERQYGLKYVIWRPFNIITPLETGEKEQGISHVFADFIRRMVIDKVAPIPIFGDGEQIRCFTWIEDVAKPIAFYSFKKITDNKIYNLGNPEPVSMKGLADIIYTEARAAGLIIKKRALTFKSLPSFDDDVRKRIPDISKAKNELGWFPAVRLSESVKRCLLNIKEVYGK
jgi:UDP-glucose 4-epimerase